MTQAKLNIHVRSSDLLETLGVVRQIIDHELGDGWDVTVDVNYEQPAKSELPTCSNRTECGQDTTPSSFEFMPSSAKKSNRKVTVRDKKNVENPLEEFQRVYTSYDFDLQTDTSGIVSDPTIPAPWESHD